MNEKRAHSRGLLLSLRRPDHWGEALCSCCIRLVRWPFHSLKNSTCPVASSFLPMAGRFKAASINGGTQTGPRRFACEGETSCLELSTLFIEPVQISASSSDLNFSLHSSSILLGLVLTGMPTLAGLITSSLHLPPHPSSPPGKRHVVFAHTPLLISTHSDGSHPVRLPCPSGVFDISPIFNQHSVTWILPCFHLILLLLELDIEYGIGEGMAFNLCIRIRGMPTRQPAALGSRPQRWTSI